LLPLSATVSANTIRQSRILLSMISNAGSSFTVAASTSSAVTFGVDTVAEHASIATAIVHRDAEAAGEAMREHLRLSEERLLPVAQGGRSRLETGSRSE
jgi:DNA-binding GntR family transcriptional regulator